MPTRPRLLLVAHGTASVPGTRMTEDLADLVRSLRPGTPVDLCYLDLVEPRLADALTAEPTVVVPLLLSTGYHVESDIPAAVGDRPRVRIARHLGPDPLVVDAVADRVGAAAAGAGPGTVFLVGAGSRRLSARGELLAAAEQLGGRLGREVLVHTMADDLRAAFASAAAPITVATYLLTQGRFVDDIRAAAAGLEVTVSEPVGAHAALARLVWQRYDEAMNAVG